MAATSRSGRGNQAVRPRLQTEHRRLHAESRAGAEVVHDVPEAPAARPTPRVTGRRSRRVLERDDRQVSVLGWSTHPARPSRKAKPGDAGVSLPTGDYTVAVDAGTQHLTLAHVAVVAGQRLTVRISRTTSGFTVISMSRRSATPWLRVLFFGLVEAGVIAAPAFAQAAVGPCKPVFDAMLKETTTPHHAVTIRAGSPQGEATHHRTDGEVTRRQS